MAAAVSFWLSWLLMPGVGVTDAQRILELVSQARASVATSVALQLLSAALYVPALVGVATLAPRVGERAVRSAAIVLLLGAMGSATDALIHLLAYAMTQPGLEPASLVPVMRFMQGPALRLIAPLLFAFFVGSAWLSLALSRAGVVSRWNPWLHAVALAVALAGSAAASAGTVAPRAVGLVTLALVSAAQAWVGLTLLQLQAAPAPMPAR